jgi:hypothetical protein
MQRLLMGAVLISATFFPGYVQAQPVEYVRICDQYGAGFFYIPGTEQCYRPNDGQIRYETENGTVITETPFAARVREMEAQGAISNALEDPDLVEGEKFGVRLNWGATETADAVGLTGAILLGDNMGAGGARMIGTAGLGYSDGYIGARFGFQMNW